MSKKQTPIKKPEPSIQKDNVERYLVRNNGDWAFIYLEQFPSSVSGQNAANISINSSFGKLGYNFGGIGDSFKEFLIDCDMHYLLEKLYDDKKYIEFSFEKTIKSFLLMTIEKRDHGTFDKTEARRTYNFFKEMDSCSRELLIEKILNNKIPFDEPWELMYDEISYSSQKFWEKIWIPFINLLKKEITNGK